MSYSRNRTSPAAIAGIAALALAVLFVARQRLRTPPASPVKPNAEQTPVEGDSPASLRYLGQGTELPPDVREVYRKTLAEHSEDGFFRYLRWPKQTPLPDAACWMKFEVWNDGQKVVSVADPVFRSTFVSVLDGKGKPVPAVWQFSGGDGYFLVPRWLPKRPPGLHVEQWRSPNDRWPPLKQWAIDGFRAAPRLLKPSDVDRDFAKRHPGASLRVYALSSGPLSSLLHVEFQMPPSDERLPLIYATDASYQRLDPPQVVGTVNYPKRPSVTEGEVWVAAPAVTNEVRLVLQFLKPFHLVKRVRIPDMYLATEFGQPRLVAGPHAVVDLGSGRRATIVTTSFPATEPKAKVQKALSLGIDDAFLAFDIRSHVDPATASAHGFNVEMLPAKAHRGGSILSPGMVPLRDFDVDVDCWVYDFDSEETMVLPVEHLDKIPTATALRAPHTVVQLTPVPR